MKQNSQPIRIDGKSCIKCGKCVRVCPAEIMVQPAKGEPVELQHTQICIACVHCVDVCPTESVIHGAFPREKIHPIDRSLLPTPEQVMLRRGKFRDYYDLYCIFQQDPDVMKFVKAAGDYSNHLFKSKHILAMLTNHNHFDEDRNFEQLEPRISITPVEIEGYIKGLLKQN